MTGRFRGSSPAAGDGGLEPIVAPPGSGSNLHPISPRVPDPRVAEARAASETPEQPGLREYWDAVWRRRWLLLATFAAVVIATAVVTFNQTPIHRATAALLVEPDLPGLAGLTGDEPASLAKQFYQTQYEVIRSNKVMQKAFEVGNLAADPNFAGADDPVEALRSLVHVNPVTDSQIVRVSVDHPDRDAAIRLADIIAGVYIDFSKQDRRSNSRNAFEWLSGQIDDTQERVEQSERAMLAHDDGHDLVSIEKRQALLEEQLETQSQAFNLALDKTRGLDTVLAEVGRMRTNPELVESLPRDLESNHVRMLKEELSGIEVELAKLSRKYKAKHPDIVALESQRQVVKQGLAAEAQKIYDSVEVERRIAAGRAESLRQSLDAVKTELMGTAERAIRFRTLQREAESNRQLHDVLLHRLREADIGGNVSGENIRVLDAATAPMRPYKPRIKLNLALGLVAGLLLGSALCFVVDSIDNTLKTEDDISGYLGEPSLGVIPRFRGTPRLTGTIPETVLQSYDNVKTKLRLASVEREVKTLLVTSAIHIEGKTLSSALMAMSFARAGFRVLLIDADMFRSDLGNRLQVQATRGLSDYLTTTGVAAVDLRCRTHQPNLHVIVAGKIPDNPAELLGTLKMRQLIETMRASYDMVIIDSPPVTVALDIAFLASMVDGVAIVVKAGRAPRRLVKKVVSQLKSARANVLGVILTAAEVTDHAAGHYYYYGRGRTAAKSRPSGGHQRAVKPGKPGATA